MEKDVQMINTKNFVPTHYHAILKLRQNVSVQIQGEVSHKLKKVVQQRHKHRVLSIIWHGKTFQND
jgi:hypothetical protein